MQSPGAGPRTGAAGRPPIAHVFIGNGNGGSSTILIEYKFLLGGFCHLFDAALPPRRIIQFYQGGMIILEHWPVGMGRHPWFHFRQAVDRSQMGKIFFEKSHEFRIVHA